MVDFESCCDIQKYPIAWEFKDREYRKWGLSYDVDGVTRW